MLSTGNTGKVISTTPRYIPILGPGAIVEGSETDCQQMICAGDLSNLYVKTSGTPAVGQTLTFTVRKNGSSTAMQVVLNNGDTDGSYSAGTISCALGDKITIEYVYTGSLSSVAMSIAVEFTPTTSQRFWLSGGCKPSASTNDGADWYFYTSGHRGGTALGFSSSSSEKKIVSPMSCTIKEFHASVATAPGTSKSWTFTFLKNGSSIGTVSISGASTSGSSTGLSLSLAKGDTFGMKITGSGAPTVPANILWGSLIQPSVDGHSILAGYNSDPPGASSTNYVTLTGESRSAGPWGLNPPSAAAVSSLTPFSLSVLSFLSHDGVAPGASKSNNFRLYVNDIAGSCAVSVYNLITYNRDDIGTDGIPEKSILYIQNSPSGTPSQGSYTWSADLYISPNGNAKKIFNIS